MIKFLQASFGHRSISEHVHSLMVETKQRSPLKENEYMRASSIFDACPREEALFFMYNIVKSEVIKDKLWKTFYFGRIFETMFRDDFLGKQKLVIGKWECLSCGFIPNNEISPRYARPDACEICGSQAFKYVEEDLISEVYGISGHPDGFILWDRDYYILELKTANSINYARVQADPFPRHVAQVQVYMLLTGYKKALIWYFNKDTSEDVCHEVGYDPAYAESLVMKTLEYKKWHQNKTILPVRICPNSMCARARRCQVSKLCFV